MHTHFLSLTRSHFGDGLYACVMDSYDYDNALNVVLPKVRRGESERKGEGESKTESDRERERGAKVKGEGERERD